MVKNYYFVLFFFFFYCGVLMSKLSAQPIEVKKVLEKSTKNSVELEKAVKYFQHGDSLKLKALYFLLSNMDIHYSMDYYWADSAGKKILYNELDYADFDKAVNAFEDIKHKNPGIHPVPIVYRDIDTIKADFLIENIEMAFKAWKSPYAKHLSFDDFCEYILPYRVGVEPLQNWRKIYQTKFSWVPDSVKSDSLTEVLKLLSVDLNKWFINTFGSERRGEPLPRLGSLQLLQRKKGPCEDIAALEVFSMRSQGVPATYDFIPYWATSSGAHFINSTLDKEYNHVAFDVIKEFNLNTSKLSREPAKVIRTTYAKQKDVPLNFTNKNEIPKGFMQVENFIDVTDKYWPVKDLKLKLVSAINQKKLAYACVLNYGGWKPAWWGQVSKDSVLFTSMPKGAVYLPAYFDNGRLFPAGYPIALGYNNELVLKPNLAHKRTIVLEEQSGYLLYRPGKKYKLMYWDNAWKQISEKMIEQGQTRLEFGEVPMNALLLLIPEYSQKKERPFIITDTGERVWF